ncbi:dihydrodipicolinate synthase family protein [Verticiella sediminum]|uniref:Dihydrodipicolinate synthase family protein n=1 Tax=Verticiella sediminum TaxID=1247510 RepID=A0A556A7C7_9BURK|nr:dihydrodipicolinate synthase family protein [Verticiella sediminum]TSH88790.1 dihydrodipicolinate synthase family protein [Verticiella sediminum]
MTQFAGTYTIMVTPFDEDGSVDVEALRRYVDWQIDAGIRGLIPLGSTGEFLSMTDGEIDLVTDTVVRQAAGRVPVIVGATAEDSRVAARKCRRAEALGADGVMVLPPFYSTPTPDEIFRHYACLADGLGIPVMVYNNPAVANVDLSPQLIARLGTIPNCCYVKESTLDVTRVRDILRYSDGRVTVFGGIMGYESYLEGALGWASVPANGAPAEFARLPALIDAGDVAGARASYLRLLPLVDFVAGQRYVAGTKAVLRQLGLPVGSPRPPRLPLTDADLAAAAGLVQALALPAVPPVPA